MSPSQINWDAFEPQEENVSFETVQAKNTDTLKEEAAKVDKEEAAKEETWIQMEDSACLGHSRIIKTM